MADNALKPNPIDTLPFRLAVVLIACLLALALLNLPIMAQFERDLYDSRAASLAKNTVPDDRIVLILIDEESLDRLEPAVGRWPWPRELHAVILDYCSQARVVAMDILLAEESEPLNNERTTSNSGDIELARIVAKHSNFVAAVVADDYQSTVAVPRRIADCSYTQFNTNHWPNAVRSDSLIAPYLSLQASAKSFGHVNNETEVDGNTRRYPAIVQVADTIIPSLALAVVQEYHGLTSKQIASKDGTHHLELGNELIPLDDKGWYRFSQPSELHTAYRFADVMLSWEATGSGEAPKISPDVFKDKIVIVGSVAAGLLQDITVTAGAARTPGIRIHADVIDAMINGRDIRMAPRWIGLLLLIILGIAPLSKHFERSHALIAFSLICAGLFYLLVFLLIHQQRLMVPMVGPLLALLLSSIGLGSLYWYQEQRRRRWLEALEVAKQKFTDMLVHDLKNAIVPLNMAVQLSRSSSISQSFILNELPMYAERTTNQLLLQINSILDIRKMQEGQMPLEPTVLDPVDAVSTIIETYHLTASHSNVKLVLANEVPTPQHILLDPDLFKRVIENLLWNAIKYATPDTPIKITCATEAINTFRLDIGNHSPIIPEKEIQNIFGAFVSGSGAKNTLHEIPSSGLGLAFCKLAIEAHDGTIVLNSPWSGHDDGVCVTVRIPIKTIQTGPRPEEDQ